MCDGFAYADVSLIIMYLMFVFEYDNFQRRGVASCDSCWWRSWGVHMSMSVDRVGVRFWPETRFLGPGMWVFKFSGTPPLDLWSQILLMTRCAENALIERYISIGKVRFSRWRDAQKMPMTTESYWNISKVTEIHRVCPRFHQNLPPNLTGFLNTKRCR